MDIASVMDVWDDLETDTESEVCEYSAESAESADSADDNSSDQVGAGQHSTHPATPAGTSRSPRISCVSSYDWQEVTAGK